MPRPRKQQICARQPPSVGRQSDRLSFAATLDKVPFKFDGTVYGVYALTVTWRWPPGLARRVFSFKPKASNRSRPDFLSISAPPRGERNWMGLPPRPLGWRRPEHPGDVGQFDGAFSDAM